MMTQTRAADPPSPTAGTAVSTPTVQIRYRVWSVRQGSRQVRVSDPTALMDEQQLRFAMGQPTTDDPVARTWARALVQHTLERGLPPADATAEAWLAPAWQLWRSNIAPPTAAPAPDDAPSRRSKLWNPAKALDLPVLGAASICAVELTPLDRGGLRLSALFQGDVSLFQIRGRSTVLRLPLRQASQFGSSACFFSEPIPPRAPPRRIQHDVRAGDLLALASPPLAQWLYARLELGIDPWPALLQLPDDDAFGDLILRERASGQLADGDVVFLLVRTAPPEIPEEPPAPVVDAPPEAASLPDTDDPDQPPSPEGAPHPHDLVEPRQPLAYALKMPPAAEAEPPHEDLPLPESTSSPDEDDIILDLDPEDIEHPLPAPTATLVEDDDEEEMPTLLGAEPLMLGAVEDMLDEDDEDFEDDEIGAALPMTPGLSLQMSMRSMSDDALGLHGLQDVVRPGAIREGARAPALLDAQIWDADDTDDVNMEAWEDETERLTASFFEKREPPAVDALPDPRPPPLPEPPPRARAATPEITARDTVRLLLVMFTSSLIVALGLTVIPRLLSPPDVPVPVAATDDVPAETPDVAAARVPAPAPPVEETAPPVEVAMPAPAPVPSPELTALVSGVTALQAQLTRIDARLETAGDRLAELESLQANIARQDATIREQGDAIKALEARLETLSTIPLTVAAAAPAPTPAPRAATTTAAAVPKAKAKAKAEPVAAVVPKAKAKAKAEPEAAAATMTAAAATADGQLSGVKAKQGQSAGWVRCVAPLCVQESRQAVLQGAAPAWASPYSESRSALVGSGRYAILDTAQVAGETWVEIRFR